MSDLGYGHDDISCMTYDIHVDILLECVFAVRPLHVHLGGGVTLVGDYHYWALLTSSWDPPFRYTRRRRSFEAVSMKKAGLWP